ncbi:MAG: SDR family NAD(P)-dependent oxidoreductase [Oscillospiraceae bacterium]|nr:SDR family NAD(P)-dependent oxidoreductase [Oscillospiraceae bacterium]
MNIVIIGATQGLGYELARKFLEEGHIVAAGVVERETPPALQKLEEKYGQKLRVFRADVTDDTELEQGAKLCASFMGEVDALCNVAGVLLPGDRVNLIHECDPAELRKTFEVNTLGAVFTARAFYPVMKRGGMLLTITSEGPGIKNCGTWVPCYGLSKTAATKVPGMFNAAVDDVDFYAVHPGRMNTEMGRTTAQIEAAEAAEGIYRLMTGEIPASRAEWYIDYLGRPMAV